MKKRERVAAKLWRFSEKKQSYTILSVRKDSSLAKTSKARH